MKKLFYRSFAGIAILSVFPAMATNAASMNPLIEKTTIAYDAVPFDKVTAKDYEEAVMEGIRRQNAEINAIVTNAEAPTFENTVVALDRSGRLLNKAVLALSNVEHAVGDTTLMNLMAKITPVLSDHSSDIMLNKGLWDRVRKVYETSDARKDLTPEDRMLIKETYHNFVESGADLPQEKRERFKKLNSELSDLTIRFGQNIANDMKSDSRKMWLRKSDLAGLPESIVKAAFAAATEDLKAQGKDNDGDQYLFTVYAPSYGPFMKYSERRDLREKLYRIYNTRNIGGPYDNMQVLKDIANVRLELANLMGYKTFADYQLKHTMAGSSKAVNDFLGQLKDAYTPAMKKEILELEAYARQTEGDGFTLRPWDYSFWANKLKNEKYSFNDEDMKPYFELNNTIEGVFGLANKLYGYKFKENKNIPVYHPDVKAFDVFDKDGKIMGLLYTDFFYRGGKSPGAWETEFRGEWKDDNGEKTIPLISIVMNFSKPVGNEAVLLTPSEVNTFLHEFGHALHALSADTKYASLSGTNVYHDFVELFSQFNENYLTEKKFLDGFARHHKTGKKMPQDLIDKFVKSSQFGAAYACMRQLNFGFLDMAYYSITEPLRASADIFAFEEKAIDPVRIFAPVEGCSLSPSFGHIFSGGYAAGYYGYKWAESLDADAFAAFKENGIFDKKTAAKFQKMLRSGGTVNPMELYIEFRGKQPTIDALMVRDGIK